MSEAERGKRTTRAADMAERMGTAYRVTYATTGTPYNPAHAFTCQRCGGEWKQERAEPPARCPCCGYARWKEKPEARTCQRCGHSWSVPQGHPKGKCPNCNSRLWAEKAKRGKNAFCEL